MSPFPFLIVRFHPFKISDFGLQLQDFLFIQVIKYPVTLPLADLPLTILLVFGLLRPHRHVAHDAAPRKRVAPLRVPIVLLRDTLRQRPVIRVRAFHAPDLPRHAFLPPFLPPAKPSPHRRDSRACPDNNARPHKAQADYVILICHGHQARKRNCRHQRRKQRVHHCMCERPKYVSYIFPILFHLPRASIRDTPFSSISFSHKYPSNMSLLPSFIISTSRILHI